jgi:hypothetical protein
VITAMTRIPPKIIPCQPIPPHILQLGQLFPWSIACPFFSP